MFDTAANRTRRPTNPVGESAIIGLGSGGTAGSITAGKGMALAAGAKTGAAVGLGKGLMGGLAAGAVAVSPVGVGVLVAAITGALYAAGSCRRHRASAKTTPRLARR